MTDKLHDEQLFAYKVRHALEHGADNLDGITRNKLQAARQNALAHQKTSAVGLSLAGIGHFTSDILLPQARTLVAISALVIGVVGTYYWNNFQQAEDNEEVDSALLSTDLPINAYLDHGFHAWLEQPSASEPSQSPQE